MTDYKKMYYVLCRAVDEVIEPLGKIPLAYPSVKILQAALLDAEEIYISSTAYIEETSDPKVFQIKTDTD